MIRIEGLYLNKRNNDLVEINWVKYNTEWVEAIYLCPVTDKECSTDFPISDILKLDLVYIGEI